VSDYAEMRRLYDQYRWELVTKEALRNRQMKARAHLLCLLGSMAAWGLIVASIIVFGPAFIQVARAIWRGM
jgi:hypothetical protein